MKMSHSVTWLILLALCLPVAFCALSHPLQTHLMQWKTLPTGERVSCPEKMHRHHLQAWKHATSVRFNAIARGRNLVATNTTAEVNALLAFRGGITTDPTGALANWTSENAAEICSTWKGVACDELGQFVTGIELSDLELTGSISPMIGDLAHLSSLNLSGSRFSGPIPGTLGRCFDLSVLDLSNNSLTGQVPSELFTLPNLEVLWLLDNQISGSLPEIDGCRSLSSLWIDNNLLSGLLPNSLSRCQNLTMLSFTNNQLNGSIPAALGGLRQLQELWLDQNNFTGQ
jgi:LRR receptor-like serine/threonine-protein kinase FLS2